MIARSKQRGRRPTQEGSPAWLVTATLFGDAKGVALAVFAALLTPLAFLLRRIDLGAPRQRRSRHGAHAWILVRTA
jgi:hypothetical protein